MSKLRVFVIAALSADGFIARASDELADWTSKEDKKLFVELTKRAGVMVMGGNTYRTIGRALPGRRTIVYTRGQIADNGVEATTEAPAKLVERLGREGYAELAVCGGGEIYDMFLAANAVDELYLTVEPVLFGQGVSLARSPLAANLKLIEIRQLNDNAIMLHYEVQK